MENNNKFFNSKIGFVIVDKIEVVVNYYFSDENTIHCMVRKSIDKFKTCDTFYTHYKSLLV